MSKRFIAICILSGSFTALGQSVSGGSITGNMESTFQYLNPDSIIGATQPDSKGLLNSYMNIFYTNGNFKAGGRIESYLPRIQGYPNRFDGTGIGMRYAGFVNDYIDITLGNFYEQFGSGLTLRAYEDRNLGYDNMMDGARVILRPYKGIQLKGIYGKSRFSFADGKVTYSPAITRGFDGQFHLNELFPKIDSTGLDINVGASFVSKYQKDDNADLILPENVGIYGGRFDLRYKGFSFNVEGAQKINDPSSDNAYIYNRGHALVGNFTYSRKGLGITLSAKSVDNMSFRSDRAASLQDLLINFLPALNKTHTYNLVATLYPYATQPLGEMAFQGEVQYMIKKGSKLGGKYGIPVSVNYSSAYLPLRNGIDSTNINRVIYQTKPFQMTDSLLWQDINFQATYKVNKQLQFIGSYYNISLNNDIGKVTDEKGIIRSHIAVLETSYRINKKHSIRTELQGLFTDKDKGNWATLVAEWSISPGFFVGVMDQYNYGNKNKDLRLHYLIGTFGWVKESTRITINYGRQRAGLFCVGGVCRFVPASNGLTLSLTHSF